jgi:hypothetical protein
MSKNSQSTSNFNLDTSTQISDVKNSYGTDSFSFFWLIFAGTGMMLYYISEMINRVLFVVLDNASDLDVMWRVWRIVDSAYLTFMFIPIGIQALSWKRTNLGLDSKKQTKRIFFSVIGAGVFLSMYEILTELRAELD